MRHAACFAIVAIGLLVTSVSTAQPRIGVIPSTLKVPKRSTGTTPASDAYTFTELLPSSNARISAAKNEFEAFQVIVDADATPLGQIDVLKPTLTHSNGVDIIPATAIRISRLAFVALQQPSNEDSANWAPWGPGFALDRQQHLRPHSVARPADSVRRSSGLRPL